MEIIIKFDALKVRTVGVDLVGKILPNKDIDA